MRAVAAVLVLGLLAGCGAAPGTDGAADGVGRVAPPPSGNPAAALAGWQSFPVGTSPRPLVLTGGTVLDPPTGFATGEDKVAYLAGRYELAAALPAAPAASEGYPVLSARAALDELRSGAGSSEQVGYRLRIIGVRLTSATFGTDRGPRALPAWQFTLAGVAGSVRVLAVARSRLWPAHPRDPVPSDAQAGIAADDRTVTYSFYGSPAGPSPCGADYAAQLTEFGVAAVVGVREVTPNPAGSRGSTDQPCLAIAARRTVTVRLATPLGDRVLLTPQGEPITVVKR